MDSLFGMTLSKLIKLLKDNKFCVSIKKIPHIIVLFISTIRSSMFVRKSSKLSKYYTSPIEKPPIFILGHWRSGTTFLHNLLIQDDQFIYPRIFEVIHPFTFLYLREKHIDEMKRHKNKNRPMDNVKNGPMSAGEEEFAMAALTLKSPIIGWVFPKRFEYYERYLCFENVNNSEIEEWKKEYLNYLGKINSDKDKTLILKSPTNTARIRILLEMFPNAKFINIHRNPYNVYNSTKKLHNTAIKKTNMQVGYKYDIHQRIINTYKKVYKSYFSQKELIKKENFIDISFEELEKDTVKTIEKIYSSLNIPGYEKMKPELVKYLKSIDEYKKNKHPEIKKELKKEIYTEWKKCFDYWGYNESKENDM